eukprot:TRINITY_DN38115_c0_g1_i4.p1 TRINITY_DN38115_c0_g1~~TRINITY_DN38115_c0_g1_i4.p1  ORF type:complete len:206 (+),score=53.81 TRINITY_DN38115_c0_g1_i4:192-809(+)
MCIRDRVLARAGVHGLWVVDDGVVNQDDVARWGYERTQVGMVRAEAMKLVVANLSGHVEVRDCGNGEAGLQSMVGGCDVVVVDCTDIDETNHKLLGQVCLESKTTLAELHLDKSSGCGWWQMHMHGVPTEASLDLSTFQPLPDPLWNALLVSTASTVTGLLAQNIFKWALETGDVEAALLFHAGSMQVQSIALLETISGPSAPGE